MAKQNNALTPRDKEIIFTVAKSLGFESELNSEDQITEDRIRMIVFNLKREGWKKDRFHSMDIASFSFIRACGKVCQDIYRSIPLALRPSFPTRNEECENTSRFLHLSGWEKESIREYIIFF